MTDWNLMDKFILFVCWLNFLNVLLSNWCTISCFLQETPVISINDQISTVLQQHTVETSKLNPVEYPEVGSSESEMEFIFDVSEPPEVLPVSSQLRKSSRISPSSNILLNVENNINDNYIFYDKLS